jgi:hypothetical protein
MAQQKVVPSGEDGKLFLVAPLTEMAQVVAEAEALAQRFPRLRAAIEADQDRRGLAKKKAREEVRRWEAAQTPALPRLGEMADRPVDAAALRLGTGCPRLPWDAVLVFVHVRGFIGSLYSREAECRMRDSRALEAYLFRRGLALPGRRTIGDNLNALSQATLELILDCQIGLALSEELDDFGALTADSTAVEADSCWPTDSGLMLRALERALRLGDKLARFGLPALHPGHVPRWLKQLHQLDYQINVTAGKANGAARRRKLYRQFLRTAGKAVVHLLEQFERLHAAWGGLNLRPDQKARVRQALSTGLGDLGCVARVYGHCEARVFKGRTVPSRERILSLSDRSAALIEKGDRDPLLGYRPQLARSAQGLVTAFILPQGNSPDCLHLRELVARTAARTGRVPESVSADDGYSCGAEREAILKLGVRDLSFSGAKGRKLTGEELWDSPAYRELRRCRSAVESLMFCLKATYHFGRLTRRGLEAARAEMTEKILAYNLCRIIELRRRRQERLEQLRLTG